MSIKRFSSCVSLCAAMLVLVSALASCEKSQFKVSGNIEGADHVLVVVEKSDYLGNWMVIDSARTSGNGKFSMKIDAPAAPDIYRMVINGKYVYFPIDSFENVKVSGKLASLEKEYSLKGSEQAEKFAQFDKDLYNAIAKNADISKFKRDVFNRYIHNTKGDLLSYYILTKQVNGKMLYDVLNHEDSKYFAAVATAYTQFKPNDPRTKYLENAALAGLRQKNGDNGRKNIVQAQNLNMIEISLPDPDGQTRNLSDELKYGKTTVVIFSLMNHPDAPAFNKALAELLSSKNGNVRFYQISYDDNMYAWREAARNLPWTNVFDAGGRESITLAQYNLQNMPSFYIYSPSGELSGKAESIDELKKQLAKF